jgi:hypothetical protein
MWDCSNGIRTFARSRYLFGRQDSPCCYRTESVVATITEPDDDRYRDAFKIFSALLRSSSILDRINLQIKDAGCS